MQVQEQIQAAESATKAKADKPAVTPKILQATSGKEWRKMREQGVLVDLPSGFVARLRPIGLMALFSTGKIPDNLTPLVAELVTAERVDSRNAIQKATESMMAITQLYDLVCKECFLEPKVVDNPKSDDEISLADIPDEDKQYVLAVANAPSIALRSFRDEQASSI